MNRKSVLAVLLLLFLAAASILGLPVMAREMERKAEAAAAVASVSNLSNERENGVSVP